MNTLTKKEMRNKIRKLLGFPITTREYFNNDEMISIIKKINPTWKRKPKIRNGKQVTKRCFGKTQKVWLTEHINILPEGVPNWTKQKVVGTHPNSTNLKNILTQLKKVSNKKLSPLMLDIKAIGQITTHEQRVDNNCDGEKDSFDTVIRVTQKQSFHICYDNILY